MKKYSRTAVIILVALFLFTCTSSNSESPQSVPISTELPKCKPYFDFDQADHYYIDITEDAIMDIDEKAKRTKNEQVLEDLLLQYFPKNLHDTMFVKKMEKAGFIRTALKGKELNQVNEVLCEKERGDIERLACIAIYRDILILRKRSKIVGVVKICFTCDQNILVGSHESDLALTSSEYKTLYHLLHATSKAGI